MKICLVSDSHRNNDALVKIKKNHHNIDLYLHAGDSESHEFEIEPFVSVKGNCDYFYPYPDFRLINTEFGRLLMTHKPIDLNKYINKYHPLILVHGHTHVPRIEYVDNRLYINPGSLSYPRSSYGSTYMILDIKDDEITVSLFSVEEDALIKKEKIKKR